MSFDSKHAMLSQVPKSTRTSASEKVFQAALQDASKQVVTLLKNFTVYKPSGSPDLVRTNAAVSGALNIKPLVTKAEAVAAGVSYVRYENIVNWSVALPMVKAALDDAAGR